eukprot:PhM_4_TR14537/c0_g2_i1/m.3088/K22132/tcdA; tRNA threonylcarbamoyladenosine dehydratase
MTSQSVNGGMYERTHVLVGDAGIAAFRSYKVMVIGLGGVGAYAAEALCRAGIGSLTIVDHDVVSVSNKNRQLLALDSTVGESKVEMMRRRLMDINPSCRIYCIEGFLLPQDCERLLTTTLEGGQRYDYVVDAIDSLSCKMTLLETCVQLRLPVVTSGGAGGRVDPTKITITDVLDVNGDALMARIRHELKFPREAITCVWSTEVPAEPLAPQRQESAEGRARAVNGTISYMPCLFGNFLASVVIRAALGNTPAAKLNAPKEG